MIMLERAVSAVKEGGMSYRAAERFYEVPFKTIRDHVLRNSTPTKRGPKTKLTENVEKKLSVAIKEMGDLGHG